MKTIRYQLQNPRHPIRKAEIIEVIHDNIRQRPAILHFEFLKREWMWDMYCDGVAMSSAKRCKQWYKEHFQYLEGTEERNQWKIISNTQSRL